MINKPSLWCNVDRNQIQYAMERIKMKNGFARLGDAALLLKANIILKAMTANPHFPSPSPTLAEVTDTSTAYALAVELAANGGRQQIAEKNQLKAALIGQLQLLSHYVLYCAAGDVAVAVGSGFAISAPRSARPPLTAPAGLVLTNGLNRGELLLKQRRVPNVLSYQYQITPHPMTPESQWHSVDCTQSKYLFKGLESGKEYCCRVIAVGAKRQLTYSEAVSRIAL